MQAQQQTILSSCRSARIVSDASNRDTLRAAIITASTPLLEVEPWNFCFICFFLHFGGGTQPLPSGAATYMSRGGGKQPEFKVYVGNIPYTVTKDDLHQLFQKNVGNVMGFNLVLDRDTQRPKGFGFCSFSTQASAAQAIERMHEFEVAGRNLKVSAAGGKGGYAGGGGGLSQP